MMNQPELQPWEQILAAPLAPLREAGIGFVGSDIPAELLLASGRPFGHLPWRADAPTPAADRCSILEQWFAGAFDGLHAVVFSRADDAAQRLCYYVRELQARGRLQGPSVHMLDVALVPRETSVAHTAAALDAFGGIRSDGDNGRIAIRAGAGDDFARGVKAVQFWHAEIHQDDVELALVAGFDGLLPGLGNVGDAAEAGDEFLDQEEVGFVVLDDENVDLVVRA